MLGSKSQGIVNRLSTSHENSGGRERAGKLADDSDPTFLFFANGSSKIDRFHESQPETPLRLAWACYAKGAAPFSSNCSLWVLSRFVPRRVCQLAIN